MPLHLLLTGFEDRVMKERRTTETEQTALADVLAQTLVARTKSEAIVSYSRSSTVRPL
jgi:hypothetical protein